MNKFTRLSPATKIAEQDAAFRHKVVSNGSKRNPLKKVVFRKPVRPSRNLCKS